MLEALHVHQALPVRIIPFRVTVDRLGLAEAGHEAVMSSTILTVESAISRHLKYLASLISFNLYFFHFTLQARPAGFVSGWHGSPGLSGGH